jgi:SAM-dependent methyltransferase
MSMLRDNPYDVVPYNTCPRPQTHPDRLAAVAMLFGISTAPLERCRVLEIGCGDGSNLIPLAYSLPEARCIGVDLAGQPIAAGRRQAEALGLRNLSLEAIDLREIGSALGEFDYILAHGVYSWTSSTIRNALLAVCGARLAPNGVALVSYNAQPGHHTLQMLRQMMQFHLKQIQNPCDRVEAGRSFLHFLRERSQTSDPSRAALTNEIDALLERDESTFYHDDLAAINEPVYLWQFVAHASQHGLQYVGDADLSAMFDTHGALTGMNLDRVAREQYLDVLKLRRFRHSLVCRQGIELRTPAPEQMDDFLFSSDGSRAAVDSPLMHAFADCYPLPVSFDELLPYAGPAGALREILFHLVSTGAAQLHVFDFPCEESVTAYPRASRLARFQASSSQRVTNACHQIVELDEIGRSLLLLLDGTRDHAAIARDLALTPDAPPAEEIARHLRSSLEWMARMALLEG